MATPIEQFLEQARNTTVLVVGDVMLDAYLTGRIDRISPEAPVPVVQVTGRSARLGGAANVALNLKALGARPLVASVVGDDDAARTLEKLFAQQELPADALLRSPLRRSTVKTRVICGHQHVVRVDEEQEDDLDQAGSERLVLHVESLIEKERPAVLVLEDYDKGVLNATTITGILAAAHRAGVPVAVDPKKRNFSDYVGVDLFKPNLKELREGLKIEVEPGDAQSLQRAAAALEHKLGNRLTLLTLSEHGVYVHSNGEGTLLGAHRRSITDVSGAGDTVIAVAALALAAGLPPRQLAQLANLAGGLVCEEVGVVPIDAGRFRSECERMQLPG
jgi:rfaE bifunctional protein kinase chain/domain